MEIPKGKVRLTEEQQKVSDEATVLILAGSMVATYQLMQAKQGVALTEMVMKVGMIIAQDPTFLKRLEAKQAAVMVEYNKMLATPKIAIVPANAKLPGVQG